MSKTTTETTITPQYLRNQTKDEIIDHVMRLLKENDRLVADIERDRPYDGQEHTDGGERGRTQVSGLTYRDVRDCYVRGWIMAANDQVPELYKEALKGEGAELSLSDLFKIPDLDKVDPVAAWQCMSCEMEKMMGIYPNVPAALLNALQSLPNEGGRS